MADHVLAHRQALAQDNTKLEIEGLLGKALSYERFSAALFNALHANNKLAACTPISLRQSILHAAKMGLLIDGKESAIVPFANNKQDNTAATFFPMIAGIKKLMFRAGFVFDAMPVYQSDEYSVSYIDGVTKYIHIPSPPDVRSEKIRFYYAFAKKIDDGRLFFHEMSMTELDKRKAIAKTKDVWNSFPVEMYCKTVLHALSKKLPLDQETIELINRDVESSVYFDKMKDVTPKAPLKERMAIATGRPMPAQPALPVDEEQTDVAVELHDEDSKLFQILINHVNAQKHIDDLLDVMSNAKFNGDMKKLTEQENGTLTLNINAKRKELEGIDDEVVS